MRNDNNMKKIVSVTLMLLTLICAFGCVGCQWLYDSQYNENGVSHFLIISIDEKQPREYVGELDGYKIFAEKLDLDDTYYISVTDAHISLKEAVEKRLVSIEEFREYAWKTKKDGDVEILKYENYEMELSEDACIIRPLSR